MGTKEKLIERFKSLPANFTFEDCVNLKKVNMKSVTNIERRAFCGDKKLKKVKLNKKVKVGKKAFLFTKVKGQKTT